MIVPENMKVVLDPKDDFPHEPEAVSNYNESMYFNAFDASRGIGLWLRLGNRVNEGHAEMTCCVYLPGGRVGFMYSRPKIQSNERMDAGGMRFEVVEPFERLDAHYEGQLVLLDRPLDMANPGMAFKANPKADCCLELHFTGVSPVHGGEIVNLDGSRWALDAENAVFRGHTEQHVQANGQLSIGGVLFSLDGFGFRDKSWGPRHWHSFYWYKWLTVTFDSRFGVMLSYMGRADGPPVVSGHLFEDGELKPLRSAEVHSELDEDHHLTRLVTRLRTDTREFTLEGERVSLVPLRHRRVMPDGSETVARITESMMRYRCGDRTALGMAEYLDLLVNGRPLSLDLGHA
jgi:hypothetical protein